MRFALVLVCQGTEAEKATRVSTAERKLPSLQTTNKGASKVT